MKISRRDTSIPFFVRETVFALASLVLLVSQLVNITIFLINPVVGLFGLKIHYVPVEIIHEV